MDGGSQASEAFQSRQQQWNTDARRSCGNISGRSSSGVRTAITVTVTVGGDKRRRPGEQRSKRGGRRRRYRCWDDRLTMITRLSSWFGFAFRSLTWPPLVGVDVALLSCSQGLGFSVLIWVWGLSYVFVVSGRPRTLSCVEPLCCYPPQLVYIGKTGRCSIERGGCLGRGLRSKTESLHVGAESALAHGARRVHRRT